MFSFFLAFSVLDHQSSPCEAARAGDGVPLSPPGTVLGLGAAVSPPPLCARNFGGRGGGKQMGPNPTKFPAEPSALGPIRKTRGDLGGKRRPRPPLAPPFCWGSPGSIAARPSIRPQVRAGDPGRPKNAAAKLGLGAMYETEGAHIFFLLLFF